MNLILGNLATLKAYLLPESWQEQSAKDPIIQSLGLGVAGAFETFCDRKFGRVVDDTEEFSGDRAVFVLARYPLEEAPTLEFRHGGEVAFGEASDLISQWGKDSGLVTLFGAAGAVDSVLRVTSTGGYWLDETEDAESEGEDDEPLDALEDQPAGSTIVPDALERAWLDQCRHQWTAAKLFANTGENDPKLKALVEIDLLPLVRQTLKQYRRITL